MRIFLVRVCYNDRACTFLHCIVPFTNVYSLSASISCSWHAGTISSEKLNREDGVGTLHAFAGEGSPKTEESVDSPKWPAEYIASQQVGLSLLCAFIESTPPSLIPAPAVRGLASPGVRRDSGII